MTDPVDTGALRKAGERADYYQTGEGPIWRAAADEVDRLRTAIKDAPHDRDAECGFGVDGPDIHRCTCWKADAL